MLVARDLKNWYLKSKRYSKYLPRYLTFTTVQLFISYLKSVLQQVLELIVCAQCTCVGLFLGTCNLNEILMKCFLFEVFSLALKSIAHKLEMSWGIELFQTIMNKISQKKSGTFFPSYFFKPANSLLFSPPLFYVINWDYFSLSKMKFL